MSQSKKKVSQQISNQIDKSTRKLSKEEERKLIITQTDELALRKFSDEELDKENEKRFLIQYKANNPGRKHLSDVIRPYIKKFPLDFYRNIYRLNNWEAKRIQDRPGIVGYWTIEIIYKRFPLEEVTEIQRRNPFVSTHNRLYKYFQFLNEHGEDKLKTYIQDAITVMAKCKYWYEFRVMYAKEYGLTYQIDLFQQN